ncbi:MAG: HD domain-containing phosphohydrolase [Roseococcus sp.]
MDLQDHQPPSPGFAIAALGAAHLEIDAGLRRKTEQLLQRLEQHHPASYAHSIRVARLTMAMHAAAPAWMGCAGTALLGSLLHDIGKLDVPASALSSSLPLSPEERRALTGHPAAGAALLGALGFPAGIIEVVAHHHERWSAGGYPSGRPARDFSPLVRGVAVADAFTAMTEPGRSYRAPLTREAARRELEVCRGSHFDPEAVGILACGLMGPVARRAGQRLRHPPGAYLSARARAHGLNLTGFPVRRRS